MVETSSAVSSRLSSDLFGAEAVKFGSFTLKSGIQSPVYLDLRTIVSYPSLVKSIAEQVWSVANGTSVGEFQHVCGVPYTALPIATALSIEHGVPMLLRRKEAKEYGTKKMIEGRFETGDTCIIVEDIVTSGSSVLETAQVLESLGLKVTDAIVIVNREQGGTEMLKSKGITLHSILTMTSLMRHLESEGHVTAGQVSHVREFMLANQFQASGDSSKENTGAAVISKANGSEKELVTVESVVLKLHDIGAFRFGNYVLSNGMNTPIYMDLRLVISHPELMTNICRLLHDMARKKGLEFELICGVPYAALHLATCIAKENNIAMILTRKERKNYGTSKMVEGQYCRGNRCILVEDVCVSGQGIFETAQCLMEEDVPVSDCLLICDREQGGATNLLDRGIHVHCLIQITYALSVLVQHKRVDADLAAHCLSYLHGNLATIPDTPADLTECKMLPFSERAALSVHPVVKKLFCLMEDKMSNLCVSADVTTTQELLELADEVGPYVCLLKTHMDILSDFTPETIEKLEEIAQKHKFLLIEDRKFADIGNTVRLQYGEGLLHVAEWADLVTVHSLPGPGVIRGLQQVQTSKPRGCLLVAEMSSAGTFATGKYTQQTVKLAAEYPEFAVGFITQSRLTRNMALLHMTPGVRIEEGGDSVGQQYSSPKAVVNRGADVIIVGRGIYQAPDRVEACKLYKDEAYNAYLARCAH